LNHGKNGRYELDQTIHGLLKELQLLESTILQKSETINIVTASMNSYHNAISNHINEVINEMFIISILFYF